MLYCNIFISEKCREKIVRIQLANVLKWFDIQPYEDVSLNHVNTTAAKHLK
jgi:hypothetical protein